MGLYLKKSISVGPLRFNLSSSGIGVSAGVPGFRVGMGPRGHSVHLGAGGLYYRSTIPTGRSAPSSSSSRSPAGSAAQFIPSATHSPLENVESGCVSHMVDSSSTDLLAELNRKHRRREVWPLVAVLSALVVAGLVIQQVSLWIIVSVAAASLICWYVAYQFDQLAKTVVILYEFDPELEQAYALVHDSVARLAGCGGKWHIDARGQVYDPRYHGGAGQLVSRRQIAIGNGQPRFVQTNISPPCIPLGSKSLYFFPERVLVFGPNGVGAVSYADLSLIINDNVGGGCRLNPTLAFLDHARIPSK